MAYRITGRVVHIGTPQQFTSQTGNAYTKRDLVIAVRKFDQYTGQPTDDPSDTPKFTFMGDRAQSLDAFAVGDVVTVSFEISGREYTNRDNQRDWFSDIRPTYIAKVNAPGAQPVQQPQAFPAPPQPTPHPATPGMQSKQAAARAMSLYPDSPMPSPTSAQAKASDDLPF